MLLKKWLLLSMVLSFASAVISGPVLARTLGSSSPATDTEKRLDASARVLGEIMGTPDKGIPQDLLAKAACVVGERSMSAILRSKCQKKRRT